MRIFWYQYKVRSQQQGVVENEVVYCEKNDAVTEEQVTAFMAQDIEDSFTDGGELIELRLKSVTHE